jgi:glycosyltransferase involved in cell wall biosynthesis
MRISYCITVCNELTEIVRLFNKLIQSIRTEDDIIIQYDDTTVTTEVLDFLKVTESLHKDKVTVISKGLNGDFGSFKSNLKLHAKGDWIFSIDADEYPHPYLIQLLPKLLEENGEVDMLFVPRVNTVDGIGLSHINRYKWSVSKLESQTDKKVINTDNEEYGLLKKHNLIISQNDEDGEVTYYKPIINYPDYQTRLYKNTEDIEWFGKVHEKITGYSTFTVLPAEEQYSLYHPKEIERQVSQNAFYNTLT